MRTDYPHLAFVVAICFCLSTTMAFAQGIKLMRYDEDYSKLKDSARNFYNTLKFLPLSADKKVYLSFGGEIREEYGGKINEDWIKDQGFNYSFLQRYSLYADLNVGERLRFFAQLNSALENGSKYGPSPVDEDQLVVQNLFAEYRILKDSPNKLALRLGRQEINYGSGRLISVREGTTVRQYFTGAKLMYATPRFSLDAFVLAADEVNFGVFDNRPSHQANLWGAYSNLNIEQGGNFDFYYLGIRRDDAEFEEGIAKEVRHTIATRYWKSGGGFIYNVEAAYQFGKFGSGNIDAWTMAIELGYTFEETKLKPTVNLRNDYISGDRKAGDGKLQTFNPLYPKGGYFGFNPLIGPSNLIDLHPYLTLSPTDKLSIQADIVFNWRYSTNDGIYRPSGNFNTSGSLSNHRFIGTTYLLSADYKVNNNLSFSCGGQYFRVGDFIKDIVPLWDNSKFFNAQVSYKF
ncbi:alginate export family protein [Pedobacter sp. ISL-68]|uniref:alginate export family protein n=1 Tax=unclassified Pedobacter TaxID=2628915 RepID=UPI001BE8F412|nr:MULTISPECIES: alginate export family protein [unclassified Pedobacter]MBT2564734.1 alginate export family protein [Pedobacter sp. ISL-64]MBT2592377.1 alginate export family protein [Pedobacter sp. ISL-68]